MNYQTQFFCEIGNHQVSTASYEETCSICKKLCCQNCSSFRYFDGNYNSYSIYCKQCDGILYSTNPNPILGTSTEANRRNQRFSYGYIPINELINFNNHQAFFISHPQMIERNIAPAYIANGVNIYISNPLVSYTVIKELGKGSEGTVYLVNYKNSNDFYAMKEINYSNKHTVKDQVISKLKLNIDTNHENIMQIYQCLDFDGKLYVIQEYMHYSLDKIVLHFKASLYECVISYILKELIEGLAFLHSKGRMHRDIKSDNILLNRKYKVKLADLGSAAQLDFQNPSRITFIGSAFWMAPEILYGSRYCEKVDVWSLGIVAYELATGYPPYYQDQLPQPELFNNIKYRNPPFLNPARSALLQNFIAKCLIKNPDQRPSCGDLINDPFIACYRNSETVEYFQNFMNFWINNSNSN